MSLCQVCGATGAQEELHMRLRKEQAACPRLLNKLLFVAQVKLPTEQALDICFKCVYKIEEFHYWLCSVRQHQKSKQDRRKSVNTKTSRPTKKADTEVLIKNTCKKNIALNIPFEEEEVSSTSIPNGQNSGLDKVDIPQSNGFQELENYIGTLLTETTNSKPSNVTAAQSSLDFSYPTRENDSNEIIKHKPLTIYDTNDVYNHENNPSTARGIYVNCNELITQKHSVSRTRNEVSYYENINTNTKPSDVPITRDEIKNNDNRSLKPKPAISNEIRNKHLVQTEKPFNRYVKNNEISYNERVKNKKPLAMPLISNKIECNEPIKNKKPSENVKTMNKFDKVRDEILAVSFTQDEPDVVLFDDNPFKSSNEVKSGTINRNISLQSFNFNSWNLAKTNINANPTARVQGDPYDFTSYEDDFLPPKKNVYENATGRMPTINKFKRRCSSVDIFASQEDNNNPFRDEFLVDSMTPSQNLIKRLRAKIHLKNPF